jgi:hypothetical protein
MKIECMTHFTLAFFHVLVLKCNARDHPQSTQIYLLGIYGANSGSFKWMVSKEILVPGKNWQSRITVIDKCIKPRHALDVISSD